MASNAPPSNRNNERLMSIDLRGNLINEVPHYDHESLDNNDDVVDTSINNENMAIFGKSFNITRKQFSVISLLSIFYLLSNAYYSLMAPFLPSEALKKGISQTQVGMIFGVYELVVLVLSPIFGKYVILAFLKLIYMNFLNKYTICINVYA